MKKTIQEIEFIEELAKKDDAWSKRLVSIALLALLALFVIIVL